MQQHRNDQPWINLIWKIFLTYLLISQSSNGVLKLKLICKGFAPFILMQIIDACVCTIVNVCVYAIKECVVAVCTHTQCNAYNLFM